MKTKLPKSLPPPRKLTDEDLKRIREESEQLVEAVQERTKTLHDWPGNIVIK